MSELNGKCKEYFYKYMIPELRKMDGVGGRFFDETIIQQFEKLPSSLKNSIIIDFFDSVGMFIQIGHFYKRDGKKAIFEFMISNSFQILLVIKNYENRQDATIRAIESANDIFNNYPLRYVNL